MFSFNGHKWPISESIYHLIPCVLSFVPRAEAWRKEGFSKPVQKTEWIQCRATHIAGRTKWWLSSALIEEPQTGCQDVIFMDLAWGKWKWGWRNRSSNWNSGGGMSFVLTLLGEDPCWGTRFSGLEWQVCF